MKLNECWLLRLIKNRADHEGEKEEKHAEGEEEEDDKKTAELDAKIDDDLARLGADEEHEEYHEGDEEEGSQLSLGAAELKAELDHIVIDVPKPQ